MITRSHRLNTWLRILLILIAAGTTPLFAQISFNDFSDVSSLALNGSAVQATNQAGKKIVRLTPDGTGTLAGSAWFKSQQQNVASGFTSAFQFQITHDPGNGNPPADGLTFVVQNSSGDGLGTAAVGATGSGIGYGTADIGQLGSPIPNSLVVEFDTHFNSPYDPNGNHIAIQSCGPDANTQDHTAICSNGSPANLGIVSDLGGITLADGNVHTAVIEYDPGTLKVYIDNLGTPVLIVNTDLSSLLNLSDGNAWVGFTGSIGGFTENNDILNWTFSPANVPTPIDQNLTTSPPGQTVQTNYLFGSYNHKLQYSGSNDGDNVTVTAIPIDPITFHDTRLSGTPFSGAACVPYGGAGGNCVLFEVVCSQTGGNDCTDLNYTLFNNFDGPIISGACVLKAPIGTNNWQNIIETFTQGSDDGGGKSGSKGFSDFIFGQNCSAPPSAAITSPANGSTVIVGQPVTIGFSCAPPANAPLVTLTGCTGLLNGSPVNNGDMVTFNQVGPGSLVVTATDSILDTATQTSNFTVGQVPAFTSANNTTFLVGTLGSFTVATSGFPTPSIGESGGLPGGVSFHDNGNGTGTLSGTPVAGGTFNITFTASNSAGNAMQSFTLTVLQTPAITSANNTTFQVGVQGSFTVTTTGFPTPGLTESGALPNGVGFHDNGNGTGTLSGKPTVGGTFNISFTATNTAGSSGQNFTLTVSGGAQVNISPSSINFGNVYLYNLVSKNVTLQNTGTVTLQISKVSISGTSDDDFNFINFCGSSLKPGKSCIIVVFFYADDLGTNTAKLNIADNAPGSPQQVPLSANVIKKH